MSTWRKSSFSDAGGSSCVEVTWRKSSYSESGGSGCVEVAFVVTGVAVRDSKNTTGAVLDVPERSWHRLLTMTRHDR
jgi:hypothetical protein